MDSKEWFHSARMRNFAALQQRVDTHAGQKDVTGTTALMIVAELGALECVKLLAPREAGQIDYSGRSALYRAATSGHQQVVDVLGPLEAKTLSNNGEDALMMAARVGLSAAVPLLSPYIDLTPNKDGLTALELAINNDSAGFVQALIEHKALSSTSISMALQYAIARSSRRCIDTLKRARSIKADQVAMSLGRHTLKQQQQQQQLAATSVAQAESLEDNDNPVDIMKRLSKTARPLSAGSTYGKSRTDQNLANLAASGLTYDDRQEGSAATLISQNRVRSRGHSATPARDTHDADTSLPIDVRVLRKSITVASARIQELEDQLLERGASDPRLSTNEQFVRIKRLTDLKNQNTKMIDEMQNLLADAKAATQRVTTKLMVVEKLMGEDYTNAVEAHNASEVLLRENLSQLQQQVAISGATSERQKLQLCALYELYQKMATDLSKLWYQLPAGKDMLDLSELLAKPAYFVEREGTLAIDTNSVTQDELFTVLYNKLYLLAYGLESVITDASPILEEARLLGTPSTAVSNLNHHHDQAASLRAELTTARRAIKEREEAWEKERAIASQLKMRLQELEALGAIKFSNDEELNQRVLQLEIQCSHLQTENLALRQDISQQAALLKCDADSVSTGNSAIHANAEMHARIADLEAKLRQKDAEMQDIHALLITEQKKANIAMDDSQSTQARLREEVHKLRDILYGNREDIQALLSNALPTMQERDLYDPLQNKKLVRQLSDNVEALTRALHQESLKHVTVPPEASELQDRIRALEREKTDFMKRYAQLEKELRDHKHSADEALRAADSRDKQNSRTILTLRADYDGLQRRCIELLKLQRSTLSNSGAGRPKSATNVMSSIHNTMVTADFSGPSFTTIHLDATLDPAIRNLHNETVTALGVVESTSATPGHYAYSVAAVQTDTPDGNVSDCARCATLEQENMYLSKRLLEMDNEMDTLKTRGVANMVDLGGMSLQEYIEASKRRDQALEDANSRLEALQHQSQGYQVMRSEKSALEAKCNKLQQEVEALRAKADEIKAVPAVEARQEVTRSHAPEPAQAQLSLSTAAAPMLAASTSNSDTKPAAPTKDEYSDLLESASRYTTNASRSRPSSTKMGAMIEQLEHNMLAMATLQSTRNSRPSSKINSRANSRNTQSRPISASTFGRSSTQGTMPMDGSMMSSAANTSTNTRMFIRSNSNRKYSSTAFGGPGHISEFCARPERPRSPAANAAARLHSSEVAFVLGPNTRTQYSTPLMDAVVRRDIRGVETEMSYAGVQKMDGTTALMLAITCNFLEAVPILLNIEAGMKKENGDTALALAVRAEMYDIARLLTPKEGLDISCYSKENNRITELMVSAAKNDGYTVWCLRPLQSGLIDPSGRTALMYAARRNALSCLKMLDSEVGVQDSSGETALMMAASMGLTDVVKALAPLEHGIQTPLRHASGHKCTALMLAIMNKQLHICQHLASFEGSIRDEDNRSALDYLLADKSIADNEMFQRARAILMQCC